MKRENFLLKGALESVRRKAQTQTTHNNKASLIGTKKKRYSQAAAKKSIVDHFVSMPAQMMPEAVTKLKDTKYSGTFGSVSVVRLNNLGILAAGKNIFLEHSNNLDIAAEVRIMHALSGHPLFPYCFGFISPNLVISQLLGKYENNMLTVHTLDKAYNLHELQLVKISCQLIEGIIFMHKLGILHNDVKGNNLILHYNPTLQLKIIDFGKATLVSNSEYYNLDEKEKKKYNKNHRYLAHELRNIPHSKQTVLTDTYSVGYVLKYFGHKNGCEHVNIIGRQMKSETTTSRLTLSNAYPALNDYNSQNLPP